MTLKIKILLFIAYILTCGLFSCSDKLRSLNDSEIEVTTVNGEELSYSEKIKHKDDVFAIASGGLGSIRYLDIRASRNGVLLGKINDELDGMIYAVMVTDLNSNNKPELLLLLMPDGADNSIKITGYEYTGKNFKRFDLPDLEQDLSFGYKGKDHFYISNSKLIREFPLNETSSGQNTNSKRKLEYTLKKDLTFLMDNYEDLK